MIISPEIRVHVGDGFIAVKDRPDLPRPWTKLVPGVSLTDEDVTDWRRMEPTERPATARILTELHIRLQEWEDSLNADLGRLDDDSRPDIRADVVGQLSMLRAVRQVVDP